MTKQSLKFLSSLCKDHKATQERLFRRFEFLLTVNGAEQELGYLLMRVS